MLITKNINDAYTIQLTPTEQRLMDRIENKDGLGRLKTLIEQWMEGHAREFAGVDRKKFEQQLQGLSPAKRQQVHDILDGESKAGSV